MGQDLSIILVAKRLAADTVADGVRNAFREDPPENLVVLFGEQGPPSVKAALREFTALSLWGDPDRSAAPVAASLSQVVSPVLVFTMADHSGTGAWQVFNHGEPGPEIWMDERYTEAGIDGIRSAFGVRLELEEEERAFFTEQFLAEDQALCIFGGGGVLTPGRALSPPEVQAVIENDLDDADLECLFL